MQVFNIINIFSHLNLQTFELIALSLLDLSLYNLLFWRILIFYVGSLFVIMSLYPWDQVGTIGSPFVLTFSKLGVRSAAGIINFVVLTAALSSCNSGLFSTGRMLYNLSLQGKAPAMLSKLSDQSVPKNGILVSAAFLLIGVILNYLVPAQVFTYVTSVATFGALWIWGVILMIQLKYRESLTAEQFVKIKYPMPHSPVSNWVSMLFLALVVVVMFFNEGTRIALYIAPVWFGLLIASYYGFGMHKGDAGVIVPVVGK